MTNNLYKHWFLRYGAALVIIVAALLARVALVPVLGLNVPYVTIYPAIMIVAVVFGAGPGVFAALVGILAAEHAFMRTGSVIVWNVSFAIRAAIVLSASLYLGWIGNKLRAARAKAEAEAVIALAAEAALRQQVDLIDPTRAALIVQEMQRVVHERDMDVTSPASQSNLLRHMPLLAGAFVTCLGAAALAGWWFGIETLQRVSCGHAVLPPNTAICFILAGVALLLREWNVWRMILAGLIGAAGMLTLMEYATGISLWPDALVFREVDNALVVSVGQMALSSAVNFGFLSLALLLLRNMRNSARLASQTAVLSVGVMGMIVLVGHVFDAPDLYRFNGLTSPALLTAILFVVLALGVFFARTDGLSGVLLGSGPGAQLARRLLPAVLLATPILGRLADYGVLQGFYSDPFGMALFVLAVIISFVALILWTAGVISRTDEIRQKSETKLRNQVALMDQATDALIVREADGIIRFWNRGAEQLYGWPVAEAIGQRIHVLLRTEGLPLDVDAQLQQNGHWEGELTHIARDGSRVQVESRKTATRTDSGRMLVLESNRDITLRRKAEESAAQLYLELEKRTAKLEETNTALVASRHAALNLMEDAISAREKAEQINRELRLLQEKEKEDAARLARAEAAAHTIRAMHEGVMLLELDGTIISVNPAVERFVGLAGKDLTCCNIRELLPVIFDHHDLEVVLRGLAALRNGKNPVLPSLRLRQPDGPSFRILPSLSLMDTPDGEQRRMVVLTLKDVTDLHETTLRLEEGERKYRELVENANSIIMRITPDHNILFFNEYAQKFFGFTAEEVQGRNVIGTIVPVSDSEGRNLREMMRAISDQPEAYASNVNENICRDGRRVWIHWSNRAVRDRQGKIQEILCVGTDITQQREMEQAARRYQERLRELAERLATFEEEERWRISRYIHDTVIQNLSLSNIRLGAMVKPLGDANLPGEVAKLNQIRGLIGQAIDECRMVMSDLTPALLYELGLIPALNELAQHTKAKHGVTVTVEAEGSEIPVANTLRGLLFDSARELIVNAMKHAGPCEICVRVSVEAPFLVLSVADNGRGFAASVASADEPKKGGFGLLNIRQRVEGLGGGLDIVSSPAKGTTVTIRVPMTWKRE